MKPAPFYAFLLLLCAGMAAPAHAQTVVNPRTVEFDPSADHNAATADNQPVVQRYDLQIFVVNGTTPYAVGNLGKPAPQTDGKIRVDFSTLVTPWPLADGTYDARVVAVGPTGTAASDVSNTFSFQSQSCTYTLGAASQAFAAGGGTGSVTVTAGTGCAWTAVSNSTWVVLGSGSTAGSGTGAVNFTVTENVGGTARSTSLTIGGKSFVITQAAPVVACSYSISPTASPTFGEAGGNGTFTLSALAGCAWTAVSSDTSWLNVTNASGSGGTPVGFTVARNTMTAPRTGRITVAGQVFTVTQAGVSCSFTLNPGSQPFGPDGGTASVTVDGPTACGWTATNSSSWVTLGATSGSGGASLPVSVARNPTAAARSASVTVGGKQLAITQSPGTCSYSLSATASSQIGPGGGNGSFTVTCGSGCPWTASVTSTSPGTWVTLTASSGSGTGTVSYSVSKNTTGSVRVATIQVGGQTYTITQAAASGLSKPKKPRVTIGG